MIYYEETSTEEYSLQGLTPTACNALQKLISGKELNVSEKQEADRIGYALKHPTPLKPKKK